MNIFDTLLNKARAGDTSITPEEIATLDAAATIKAQEGEFRYFILCRPEDDMCIFVGVYEGNELPELIPNEFCANIHCALAAMHVFLVNEYAA